VARLDRLIQVMQEQRAESLQLAVGKPASLVQNGSVRPITREPLSDAQIQGLLREIASADAAAQLGSSESLAFGYRSPFGEVRVELKAGANGVAVLRPVAPVTSASGTPATAPAGMPPPLTAAAPSSPPSPISAPAPAAPVRPAQGASDQRAALEALFRLLVQSGASDLHLRTGEPPMLRLHGELIRQEQPPLAADRLEAMLFSIMAPKEMGEFREGSDTDWAYEIDGLARFRCNAGRDRFGAFGVFRVIPNQIRTAEEMGLSREVQNLCYLTKGLVVVTGPTGSGKSTTLAGLVDLINRTRTDHIITIEDPIEFVHPSKKCLVTQRQVGLHTRSFKHALRAALREDPDIILVGEMRDLETVSIAIETAETGHLVFGTLHTTTASSTIDRIIDQFPPDRQAQIRVMLSESLRGVIAQTLCKKIGGGRVAAREVLLSIPAVSNLIREGKTFQIPSIMQVNRKGGMITLNDALLELVDSRLVEPKEAYMKAVEKAGFAAALKAKRHDVSFLGEG
jgi:twitching motility protein PilT